MKAKTFTAVYEQGRQKRHVRFNASNYNDAHSMATRWKQQQMPGWDLTDIQEEPRLMDIATIVVTLGITLGGGLLLMFFSEGPTETYEEYCRRVRF